jgi:hypothetical protein
MKNYRIQNRSQKNYHSCVPFNNMSTYCIFSFHIFVLHEPGYSWIAVLGKVTFESNDY